jgi:hypothetical protein
MQQIENFITFVYFFFFVKITFVFCQIEQLKERFGTPECRKIVRVRALGQVVPLMSHPFLRIKIGCIKDSCAPQETIQQQQQQQQQHSLLSQAS